MDLLITIDARATRATVQPATPGVLPPDSMIIHPGESFYDVGYDAWRQRVGETVVVREMQRLVGPGVRTSSLWKQPGVRRAAACLLLLPLLFRAAAFRVSPPVGPAESCLAMAVSLSVLLVLAKPILELPLPRRVFRGWLVLVLVFLAMWLIARAV